jgi:predicted nucleotidyltransferase
VPGLDRTSLWPQERLLLERFVAELAVRLDMDLHAVWLFGSRARGDAPLREDSDIDVMVIAADASWDAKQAVNRALHDVARELAVEDVAWWFSVHVDTLEWLAQRRAIRSFFVGELDRDKIVLHGSP